MQSGLIWDIRDKALAQSQKTFLADYDGSGLCQRKRQQTTENEHTCQRHNESRNTHTGDHGTLIKTDGQAHKQHNEDCQPLVHAVTLH